MIDALYAASQAGRRRSTSSSAASAACGPGVPGLSENIRVRSIVGRYLEHSRIYHFANGAARRRPDRTTSARPTSCPATSTAGSRRSCPIDDPELQARLDEVLDVNLADDTLAWVLDADGRWHHVERGGTVDTHLRLQELELARRRPDLSAP